jgi:ABC-2 type transport system ATP-binding protein
MDIAVKINNLSVTLGGKVKALRAVNIEFPVGKTVGVIGPSGAGKTTLIRAIVGRLKVTDGSVVLFGQPAGTPALRKMAAYMTQELAVYTDLTVTENLAYFATMSGQPKSEVKKTVSWVLDTVDLANKADELVSNLSGGQKQRVSLAIALVSTPKLLVLDEPTVGLDPVLRDNLWGLFARLASQGTTLIISSHSMDEARRCDDLVLLREGEVIAHTSPDELLESTHTSSVEQAFLKLVRAKQ